MTAREGALLAVACLLLTAGAGEAAQYVVDASGGGDFTTVQEGVDAAASSDTLLIKAGNYQENVLSVGKYMTFLGDGVGVTVLEAASDGPALRIEDMPGLPPYVLQHLTVIRHGTTQDAIWWNRGDVELTDVDIVGRLHGGGDYWEHEEGWVGLWDSTVTSISVGGGWYAMPSTITRSCVGEAHFFGVPAFEYVELHHIYSSSSEYGALHLEGAALHSEDDVITQLTGDSESSANVVGSRFSEIDWLSPAIDMNHCHVAGDLAVDAWVACAGGTQDVDIHMEECLIEGNVSLLLEACDGWWAAPRVLHNTVAGQLTCELSSDFYVSSYHVRSNIVLGDASLGGDWVVLVATHNDILGVLTVSAPSDSVYANISADPLFCGVSGDPYALQECSPCVAAAHDGGDIGAFGVGCDCLVPVRESSWGAIKALFRQPPN